MTLNSASKADLRNLFCLFSFFTPCSARLSHHFEAENIEESHNTSVTELNDQSNLPSPTPNYSLKIEKARWCCEKAEIRSAKRARVSQQAQTSQSPAAHHRLPGSILFQGEQSEFCTECLEVMGLMQMPNLQMCPACKQVFVRKQCRVPWQKLCI